MVINVTHYFTVADPGFPVGGGGGGADPLGGGANLRRVHFLAKTYVKAKEIDPVGSWIRQCFSLKPLAFCNYLIYNHGNSTMLSKIN